MKPPIHRNQSNSAKTPRSPRLGGVAAWVRGFSLSLAALLLSLSPSYATAQADKSIQNPLRTVGEVSLVLGRAYLERGGDRDLIEAGSEIKVGDRVFTESGGHVHVRFVDDALVSVRPSSTLEVVRYDYDAAKPEKSTVKFELSEGEARAISGDAAKSARERFRMNTPIAAIGVRGTDFVVSANSRSTRALVNEGSIVVAPFSSECSIEAFGPCAVDAVELTQNTLQAVEVDQTASAPRLIATVAERASSLAEDDTATALAIPAENGRTATSPSGSSDSADAASSTDVYVESVVNEKVTAEVAEASQTIIENSIEPDVIPEPLIDFTPSLALVAADTSGSQLVWGRFSESSAAESLFAVDFETARDNREVTVSSPSGALLYRSEPNGARVDRNLSVVRFDLSAAQAFYDSASGVVAMRVGGGDLELNFIDRAFATTLNLDHIATGEIDFVASGDIADGGYLRLRTDTQRVSGAVATDGSEASYYFKQILDSGSINGFTLWGAQ